LCDSQDVLHALQEKLDIRCIEHFGLVLHNIRSPLSAKMVILSNTEKVKQVSDLSSISSLYYYLFSKDFVIFNFYNAQLYCHL